VDIFIFLKHNLAQFIQTKRSDNGIWTFVDKLYLRPPAFIKLPFSCAVQLFGLIGILIMMAVPCRSCRQIFYWVSKKQKEKRRGKKTGVGER
jgi:hypothetical protein